VRVLVAGIDVGVCVGNGDRVGETSKVDVDVDIWSGGCGAEIEHPNRNSTVMA